MGAYGIKINFSQRLQFLEGRDFLGAVEIDSEPVADANRYQSRLNISWENVLLRNPFNKSKQISFQDILLGYPLKVYQMGISLRYSKDNKIL